MILCDLCKNLINDIINDKPINTICYKDKCILYSINNNSIRTASIHDYLMVIYNFDYDQYVSHVDFALANVGFDSNSLQIKSSKESILNDILDLLKKIEYFKLLD